MRKRYVHICISLLLATGLWANDTVFVSGAVQHDGLLDWTPVMYHSNSYLDLAVNWQTERRSFRELRAITRLEMNQWPMLGYESDFAGHGVGRLSLEAAFTWGEITVGDVYGQFGSGLILNLHEDRALGLDGALRGAKLDLRPWRGLHLTLLGGKQRRYWTCYHDHAWGWNYGRDAAMGADLELHIDQWSAQMQQQDIHLTLAGSYVSKYEADDTILTPIQGTLYRYHLPRFVGAADVRAALQVKGFDLLLEYACKANDPCRENNYSYRWGHAALLSLGYSRKGLAVLLQAKFSDNMAFRSERQRIGIAGRLNHMPAFATQHTYRLAALYPYATNYSDTEIAVQGELRYTWARRTAMGGRYGTSLKGNACHIRVWNRGEAYTDAHIELDKRLSAHWWLHAMVMYQAYNQLAVEGHGATVRSGIFVLDARTQLNDNLSMRGELQYLYSPHHEGQWFFALYELSLFRHWTLSGEWLYNIGYAPDATNRHYYTAGLTFTYNAHRAMLAYTKTREGFNCSGGICRYVPQQQGISLSYSFTW